MKILRFIKKSIFGRINNFINLNNQACKARPEINNINSNNPVFYPFNIKTSKCSDNCNNINDRMQKFAFLML